MSIKNHHPLVLLFFFLTGATGLIYELVWTRILILTFGSTHFAITTVLTTFMTGLALGSLLFGKLVDKKSSPLRMYAFIELAIGIYCFLTPAVFAGIKYLYIEVLPPSQQFVTFNPYQFFLSFLGIIFPATLMGGTLPAVIKYFSETQREMAIKSGAEQTFNIGLSSGLLYAINTLGAVTGTLATGTFLLFFFGIQNSLYLAGTIDIFIALALLAGFSFRKTRPEHHDESQKREPSFDADKKEHFTIRVVPYCFLFSGFASLAYEVLWTRVLTLVLGSSIYAFTIILTAFLAGISAGSILFSNFKKRGISSVDLFAALEALIAIAAICSIFLFANLPYIFGKLHLAFSGSFWLFLLFQFGICLAVMLLPTVCMGATFPVVSDIYAKGVTTVGRRIGNIYFFNTVGAIFGSFTAGFIMVPRFGIQTSIWLVALVNLAIFSLLIILKEGSERRKKIGATICAIIVPLFLITNLPKWDKNIMTLGPYVTPVYQEGGISGRSKRLLESELLLYREGLNAVISVRKRGNHILYQANGKVEAKMIDNKPSEAWYLLGHIPLLLTPDAEEALLVGLGSGVTLGAMAEYPLKGIDVVELEPAVVEASAFFSPAHHDPLKDPRVDLHITDGRGFLSSARKNYDVIISGVSDPWISGVSNLFTKEYFENLYSKLKPGGTVAIWFQNYKTSDEDFNTGLNTFASVFPYISIWFHYSLTADLIVVGSKTRHEFDLEQMKKSLALQPVRQGLKRIDVSTPYDFFEFFLIGNDDVRGFLTGADINTDNRPILEFSLPKAQYTHTYGSAERVEKILQKVTNIFPPVKMPSSKTEKEEFYLKAGTVYRKDSFREAQTRKVFEKLLDLNPDNDVAKAYLNR